MFHGATFRRYKDFPFVMTSRSRHARDFERREADILEAALQLFAGDAWQSVTIEQIAQAVDIGKGTIYKHFTSKDELFARLALDFQQALLEELQALDPSGPVLDRLRVVMETVWSAYHRHEGLQRVVEYCERADFRARVGEATRREFETLDAALTAVFAALLDEGERKGLFAPSARRRSLHGLHAALSGAVRAAHRCRPHDEQERAALAPGSDGLRRSVIEFVMAGLLHRTPQPA